MADRALLIGVGEYQSLPALPAASSEINDLAEVLANPSIGGYDVREVTEARSAPLSEAVRDFLSGAGSEDRQLIYFACHGLRSGDDYYLAASDTDLNQVHETALSLKSLLNWTSRCQARTTLIILDVCAASTSRLESVATLSNVSAISRVALIHSSRTQDQYSAPSGTRTIFVDALTDALGRSSADTNADGIINVHELYDYLGNRFGFEDTSHQNSMELLLAGPDFPIAISPLAEIARRSSPRPTLASLEKLRPFQREAVRAIELAIESGQRDVAAEMPPGTGKTAIMLSLIYRFVKANAASRVLYLTDRTQHKVQMSDVLMSVEIEDGQTVSDVCPVYTDLSSIESLESLDSNYASLYGTFVSTVQGLTTFSRNNHDAYSRVFDLIIFDDLLFSKSRKESAGAWRKTISRYEAIKVFFSSFLDLTLSENVHLAFRYDMPSAIRDGVLVDQPTALIQAQAHAWPGFDRSYIAHERRRVFLSYALEDAKRARTIASQLRASGVDAWLAGEDTRDQADLPQVTFAMIESHAVFIALLSPSWLVSPSVREEFGVALERRGIEVIPAIIDDCAIPKGLSDRGVVDARQNIDALLRRLQASLELDLDSLNPDSFEYLVRDLLIRLDFRIDEVSPTPDAGYDFIATYHDAHDFSDSVTYVVQVKFAKKDRPSVRAVRRLAESTSLGTRFQRGLLVTTGYLTSVAMQAVVDANVGLSRLRVIDAPQLKSLLLSQPDLIGKYFRTGGGRNG